MISKPIYPYISFGTSIRFLQDVNTSYLIHGDNWVIGNIDKILRKLEQLNLKVTKRATATRELTEFKNEVALLPESSNVTSEQVSKLRSIIKDLRVVIEAETSGNFAFTVTDKRIDVQKLLSDVKSLMPEGIFDKLPPLAQYDFQQAGKAIAFELSTAAAFHLMRGTEAVLCYFYCNIVKQKRVRPLIWGNMLDSLEQRRTPPSPEIMNLLRHIKDSFRNPTQHPDKIYEIDEVQDLFSLSIDAISRMISYNK